MVLVVEADADELTGIVDRRVQARGGPGDGHAFRDCRDGVRAGRAALQEAPCALRHERLGDFLCAHDAAAAEAGGDALLHVDDAVALEDAEAWRLTVGRETNELHWGRYLRGG